MEKTAHEKLTRHTTGSGRASLLVREQIRAVRRAPVLKARFESERQLFVHAQSCAGVILRITSSAVIDRHASQQDPCHARPEADKPRVFLSSHASGTVLLDRRLIWLTADGWKRGGVSVPHFWHFCPSSHSMVQMSLARVVRANERTSDLLHRSVCFTRGWNCARIDVNNYGT